MLWTCAFAVARVINNFSAICGFVAPSTINDKTSSSLSVKPQFFAYCFPSGEGPSVSLIIAFCLLMLLKTVFAMAGSNQPVPSATALIAVVSWSSDAPFIIYPSAPAPRAAKTSSSPSREVKIRILLSIFASLICWVASIPSISGSPMSISMISGRSSFARLTPFTPLSASAIISMPSAFCKTNANPILVIV